jgi:hypothetical protein
MALGLNKILIAGTNENTPGAYWQGATNVAATTTGNVIPAGTYYVFSTSNVVIQAVSSYNTTSNVATWSNVYPINSGGFVVSDGVNVQALATTNTANVVMITVNGGQPVQGTFTSLGAIDG